MKKFSLLLLIFFMVIIWGNPVKSENNMTGLKVENFRNIPVNFLVSENDFGLTTSMVRNKVELRLREANLNPTEANFFEPYFAIGINIVDGSFVVNGYFYRAVYYLVEGEIYWTPVGVTWNYGVSGTHSRNASFILEGLDPILNSFLNEYLKANQ